MLRENKALTSLDLSNCELGPEGLCEVCNAVTMNTTLTSLNLSVYRFDDQSIASLGMLLIIYSCTYIVITSSATLITFMLVPGKEWG